MTQWQRIHLPMQEMQETRVQSLDQEDLLEEEMATHSSILAWIFPWPEELDGLQSMESQEKDTTQRLNNNKFFYEVPIIISIIMCQYLLYTLQLEMSPKKSHSQRVNEIFYLQGALYL